MVVLKEQEAIDYLASIRTTIPDNNTLKFTGEDEKTPDRFKGCLDILRAMVDLELVHLKRFSQQSLTKGLAQVIIAEHGFPDLPSWLVDISGYFNQYRQIQTRRARETLPLAEAFANADIESMTKQSRSLAASLKTDQVLSEAIRPLLPHQNNLFRALNHLSNEFPVYTSSSSEHTGMLVVAPWRNSGGQERRISTDFKFIRGSKDPSVLRNPYLVSGSNFANHYWVFVNRFYKPNAADTTYDLAILGGGTTPRALKDLHWSTDLTALSDRQINEFLTAIITAKGLVAETNKLLGDVINLDPGMNADSLERKVTDIASKTQALYGSLEDPILKAAFQNAVAEVTKEERRKIDQTAQRQETTFFVTNPIRKVWIRTMNPLWRLLTTISKS